MRNIWQFTMSLGGAIWAGLSGSAAMAAVSSGPSPVPDRGVLYDLMFSSASTEFAQFAERFIGFSLWAGVGALVFFGLWAMRNRSSLRLPAALHSATA